MCNKAWQSKRGWLAQSSSQSMKLILTLWNGILICHSGDPVVPLTPTPLLLFGGFVTGEQLEFHCEPSALGVVDPFRPCLNGLVIWSDFGQHTPKGHASEWGLLLPAKLCTFNFCLTSFCHWRANDLLRLRSSINLAFCIICNEYLLSYFFFLLQWFLTSFW